jgi:tryptophan-rich sensory protein
MSGFWVDWEPTIIAAGGVTVLAFAGAALTTIGAWYRALRKPSWQPPDWVFGPVWTIIFIFEVAAAVIGWKAGAGAVMITVFIINGLCNMLWSFLFFTRRRPDWALIEAPFLWLSVLAMMIVMFHFAGPAGWLLAPYLIWVTIATYLTYTIVKLNRPFGETA